MLWQLEYGEKEDRLRELARIGNQDLPDFIVDKPELDFGLEFYLLVFWELATCRSTGMGGEGPIPWTAINDFAIRYNIVGHEFERLVLILKSLDVVYLGQRHKASTRKNKKIGGQQNKPSMSIGKRK